RELRLVELDKNIREQTVAICRERGANPLQRVEIVQVLERKTEGRRRGQIFLDVGDERLAVDIEVTEPVGGQPGERGLEVTRVDQPWRAALIGVDDLVNLCARRGEHHHVIDQAIGGRLRG